ncbi:MAG: type II toxin-antitoxin system RelE family toxin [Sphingobacteriaceae bacterium]|jgi:mRNA interferase RelE/StbE
MQVEFLSKFSKDIDHINQKSVKNNLAKLIRLIESENDLNNIPNIKKLVGHKSAYRVRIGDYRVGFLHESRKAIFARIVHRKDIYKVFP